MIRGFGGKLLASMLSAGLFAGTLCSGCKILSGSRDNWNITPSTLVQTAEPVGCGCSS